MFLYADLCHGKIIFINFIFYTFKKKKNRFKYLQRYNNIYFDINYFQIAKPVFNIVDLKYVLILYIAENNLLQVDKLTGNITAIRTSLNKLRKTC